MGKSMGNKRVAFLGFGEAARAFHASLSAKDPEFTFMAWDILLLDDAANIRREMQNRDVEVAEPTDFQHADWIFSAVTADQSYLALERFVDHLSDGQLVIDINSVAPDKKRRTAAMIERTGADYLDMAVMAPVHPRNHQTPVLIAGKTVNELAPALTELEFSFRIISTDAGEATAIKMVRSLFVKGLEAIAVETLLAAEASGCLDEITTSISDSYPGLGWLDFAKYQFERTTTHGHRRAAEMRESAATLNNLGLRGALANEIANVQENMGDVGPSNADETELPERIAQVLLKRRNLQT